MISLDLLKYKTHLRLRQIEEQLQIFDPIRRKWVAYLPEESVRQLFVAFCIDSRYCSPGRISIERAFKVFGMQRRYDIVLHDHTGAPQVLIECKAPSVQLAQSVMDQVARYNIALKVPYLLITNGWSTIGCSINLDAGTYTYLEQMPRLSSD